jgi:AcrR family transcriptional regulator
MIGTLTKRQRITVAARELLRDKAYEKTTMEEIARAVPMSKATLYTEFNNKEEVLLEICRNHIDEMNVRLATIVEATEKDCLNTLKTMLLILVEGIYGVAASLRSPEALIFESTRLQALLADRTERMPEIIRDLFEKAKSEGEIDKQTDSTLVAKVVLSALTSYLPPYLRHFAKPSRPTLESVKGDLSVLLDLLCEGLRHKTYDRRSI